MMLIPCAELESSDEGEGDDREEDANKPAGSSSSAGPSAAPSAAPRKQQKKTVRKWCPGVQVLRLAYKKAIMPITEAVRAEIMVSALGDVSSSDGSAAGGNDSESDSEHNSSGGGEGASASGHGGKSYSGSEPSVSGSDGESVEGSENGRDYGGHGDLEEQEYDEGSDSAGDEEYLPGPTPPTQSSGASASPSASQDEISFGKLLRMLHTMDGDYPSIELLLAGLATEYLVRFVEFLKHSGGASLSQQPCDLAPVYRALKQAINSRFYEDPLVGEPPEWLQRVVLPAIENNGGLDAASLRTYVKFLIYLPALLSKCFTIANCRKGWEGLVPYDASILLSKWPGRAALTADQDAKLLAAVRRLTAHAFLTGAPEEATMTKETADVGLPPRVADKKQQAQMPVNHWRATWISSPGVLAHRVTIDNAKQAQAADKESKAADKQAKAEKKVVDAEARKQATADRLRKKTEGTERKRKAAEDGVAQPKPSKKKAVRIGCLNAGACIGTSFTHCAADEGWEKCSSCDHWSCGSKACKKLLTRHGNLHSAQSSSSSSDGKR
jgi:hypothetical protein